MEIDITDFFNQAAPMDYSASVAEIGRDAGPSTWQAARDDSEDYVILATEGQQEAFKDFARSAGFSEADDFATWSSSDLNALAIQWVSGDIREDDLSPDMSEDEWVAYEANENARHTVFRGDNGRIYWYIGS